MLGGIYCVRGHLHTTSNEAIWCNKANEELIATETERDQLRTQLAAVPEYSIYCHTCYCCEEEPMSLVDWIAEGKREAEKPLPERVERWESAWHAMTGEWPGEESQP